MARNVLGAPSEICRLAWSFRHFSKTHRHKQIQPVTSSMKRAWALKDVPNGQLEVRFPVQAIKADDGSALVKAGTLARIHGFVSSSFTYDHLCD